MSGAGQLIGRQAGGTGEPVREPPVASDALLRIQPCQSAGGNESAGPHATHRVRLELGRRQLSLDQIAGLGPGSVVRLQERVEDAVNVYVDETLSARGQLVLRDGRFGVRITERVGSCFASQEEGRTALPERRADCFAQPEPVTSGRAMLRTGCLLIAAWMWTGPAAAAAADRSESLPVPSARLPFQIVAVHDASTRDAAPERRSTRTSPLPGHREPSRATLVAAGSDQPLPLSPPRRGAGAEPAAARGRSTSRALSTVISSVAVVLGLFALLVWFSRRTRTRGRALLPGEVVQTLGRAPLNARQEMHLVRVGNKLLLLAVTATGAEPLTEITDPAEINRLAGLCGQNAADGISASLREMLAQLQHR
jgi:flagellar biogenesis protein FliO